MAQPRSSARTTFPRSHTFGNAATRAQRRLGPLWSRESLLRLLLSLLLATALWVYVTGKQDPTIAWDYGQPIPVAAANVPSGLSVTTNLGQVHLRIRVGNRNQTVTPLNFHAFVNLQGLGVGQHPHVPVQVVADPGIQVLRISPHTIPVVLERVESIHVPVRWHILAPPPPGYTVNSISAEPNTVSVTGPSSIVSEVVQAGIYIDLSQVRSGITGTYKVTAETSAGQDISAARLLLDPAQVSLVATVASLSGYKSLPVLVSLHGQPAKGYGVAAVSSSPAEVTADGAPSVLGQLTAVKTAAISLDGRRAGTITRTVSLRLPHGISSRVHHVTVHVQLASVSVGSSIEVGLTPINLPFGLAVHTRPASVLVTVVGPLSAVNRAASRMRAVVNVGGYRVGTYYLRPTVTAPRGIQVEGVYPSTVTVSLVASSR